MGDSERGSAIITTSSVFDREKQGVYELPVVMWDMRGTGSPKAQTGTNTLTIIIGDVNDNPHNAGHQNVFVYNYKGKFLHYYLVIKSYCFPWDFFTHKVLDN